MKLVNVFVPETKPAYCRKYSDCLFSIGVSAGQFELPLPLAFLHELGHSLQPKVLWTNEISELSLVAELYAWTIAFQILDPFLSPDQKEIYYKKAYACFDTYCAVLGIQYSLEWYIDYIEMRRAFGVFGAPTEKVKINGLEKIGTTEIEGIQLYEILADCCFVAAETQKECEMVLEVWSV